MLGRYSPARERIHFSHGAPHREIVDDDCAEPLSVRA